MLAVLRTPLNIDIRLVMTRQAAQALALEVEMKMYNTLVAIAIFPKLNSNEGLC